MRCHGTEGSDEDAQGTGIGKAADGERGDSSAAGLGQSNGFYHPVHYLVCRSLTVICLLSMY